MSVRCNPADNGPTRDVDDDHVGAHPIDDDHVTAHDHITAHDHVIDVDHDRSIDDDDHHHHHDDNVTARALVGPALVGPALVDPAVVDCAGRAVTHEHDAGVRGSGRPPWRRRDRPDDLPVAQSRGPDTARKSVHAQEMRESSELAGLGAP
jgi:hypothetical protein